jgi:lipopolysaccharide export LptBFGC system permease protein LptF
MQHLMLSDRRGSNDILILATTGKLIKTNHGLTLATIDGTIQSKGGELITGTFDSFDMDMNLGGERTNNGFKIRRIPTTELLSFKNFKQLNHKEKSTYVTEVGNRLLSPLMDFLLALIALTCLLKTSVLRRAASHSVPLSILGLIIFESGFMGAVNAVGTNPYNLIFIFIAQIAIITSLLKILFRGGK